MTEKLQTTNICKHNFNTAIQSVHNQHNSKGVDRKRGGSRKEVGQEGRWRQERGGTGREAKKGWGGTGKGGGADLT